MAPAEEGDSESDDKPRRACGIVYAVYPTSTRIGLQRNEFPAILKGPDFAFKVGELIEIDLGPLTTKHSRKSRRKRRYFKASKPSLVGVAERKVCSICEEEKSIREWWARAWFDDEYQVCRDKKCQKKSDLPKKLCDQCNFEYTEMDWYDEYRSPDENNNEAFHESSSCRKCERMIKKKQEQEKAKNARAEAARKNAASIIADAKERAAEKEQNTKKAGSDTATIREETTEYDEEETMDALRVFFENSSHLEEVYELAQELRLTISMKKLRYINLERPMSERLPETQKEAEEKEMFSLLDSPLRDVSSFIEYNQKTVAELRKIAKQRGFSRYSHLRKEPLIQKIMAQSPEEGMRDWDLSPPFVSLGIAGRTLPVSSQEPPPPSDQIERLLDSHQCVMISLKGPITVSDFDVYSEAGISVTGISNDKCEHFNQDIVNQLFGLGSNDAILKTRDISMKMGLLRKAWSILVEKTSEKNYYLLMRSPINIGEISNENRELLVRIKRTLSIISHEEILSEYGKSEYKNHWVLIADEAGIWQKKNYVPDSEKPVGLMWSIVPPISLLHELPIADPYFHARIDPLHAPYDQSGMIEQAENALHMVASESNQNLHHICFDINDDPGIGLGENVNQTDPVMTVLNDTLPLVMEFTRGLALDCKIDQDPKISIFAERRHPMQSNSAALSHSANEIIKVWSRRDGIDCFQLLAEDGAAVLDKNPMDHPYMMISDIIGKVFFFRKTYKGSNPQVKIWAEQNKQLRKSKNIRFSNYEVGTMVKIGGILSKAGKPKDFLFSLYELNQSEYNQHYQNFLRRATEEACSSLDMQQLGPLLEKMKMESEKPNSSIITDAIFCNIEIPESHFTDKTQLHLDYGIANLGRLNHSCRPRQSEAMISRIESVLDQLSLEKVPKVRYAHRRDKYRTLRLVHFQNSFDFEREVPDEVSLEDLSDSEETIPYLGAISLTYALRGDIEKAREIEDFLWDGVTDRDRHRRIVNRMEIDLAAGSPGEALSTFFENMGRKSSEIVSHLENDPFMLSALLKTISNTDTSLEGVEESIREILSSFSESTPTLIDRHPYQRVSYWFIKALGRLELETFQQERQQGLGEFRDSCYEFLMRLAKEPGPYGDDIWRRGAQGIMLACELLDLQNTQERHPQMEKFDGEDFLNLVLDHPDSTDSITDWVSSNQPDEEDWLRPLKFNYR